MKKSYAIIAQKGGSGKTTTALALAAGLVKRGRKVLLIDADTQGNATFASNVDMEPGEIAFSGLLEKTRKLKDVVCGTEAGYDLIPFDKKLSFFGGASKIKKSLSDLLEDVSSIYDYVIIDCPPNIGPITVQALEAVDEIVIPLELGAFELDALKELAVTVRDCRKKNRKLLIAGVLLNRIIKNSNIEKVALPDIQKIAELIGTKLFETRIPPNVKLTEAQYVRQSIFDYEKDAPGAEAYNKFITELTGEAENGKIEITRRGVQRGNKRQSGAHRNAKSRATKKQ